MLTSSDFEHLKLLYDKFFKMNNLIKDLIKNKDVEGLDSAVQKKRRIAQTNYFF